MESSTRRSIHPLTAIAAVSVTLFSLVGIGAITGLIPTSRSQNTEVQQALATAQPAPPAVAVPPARESAIVTSAATETKAADKPVARKAVAKRASPVQPTTTPAAEPARAATESAPMTIAQNYPAPGMAPPPAPPVQPAPMMEPAKPVCHDCGVIESVREVEKKGEASGAGAAVGGIAGGVLGRQTGNGRGRDVMTVLGAIGGAIAGHEIEKNAKKGRTYEIDIRFDDGTTRLITQDTAPVWRSGDRVRLLGGVITASNS